MVLDIGIEPTETLCPEKMFEQGRGGFERVSLAPELRIEVPADGGRVVFVIFSGAAEQITDDRRSASGISPRSPRRGRVS